MRATFRPCSASGMAQPTIASSTAFGSRLGTCAIDRADRVHQQIVRPRVVEYAARRFADRRAGRGDDVCVLNLFAHGRSRSSVPDRLAGLHHAHDSLLRLWMPEQSHERLALEVEQPWFVDELNRPRRRRRTSLRRCRCDNAEVVLGDEAAVAHVDELRLDGGDAGAPGDREAERLQRRPVAGFEQRARLADSPTYSSSWR